MTKHKHLKRLAGTWMDDPVFFITVCTNRRQNLLTKNKTASILVSELGTSPERHGWAIGRYVIMPDHVHFFCTPVRGDCKTLSSFMQQWKQWTSKRIMRENWAGSVAGIGDPGINQDDQSGLQSPIWQAQFFDHVLRSQESYSQKWDYVRNNPVRAGLVEAVEQWAWQGEIYIL